jgi:hypothetical protein
MSKLKKVDAVEVQKAAGLEVPPVTGEKTGTSQAKGNPAKGADFSIMAKKHAAHLNSAQKTALEDIREAVAQGAAQDELAVKTYQAAFKAELAKVWKTKPATVAVYASERGTILKAWNIVKDGVKFGDVAEKGGWGYNRVKREAQALFRKPKAKTAKTADVATEAETFAELLAAYDAVINGMAGIGTGDADKFVQFKTRQAEFRDFLSDCFGPKIQPTVMVQTDEQGNATLAIAAAA